MNLLIAASVLSCGLNVAPDGTPAPKGEVAMMNAPIPNELAQSLAKRIPPPPRLKFAGEPNAMPEWIIGMQRESETRFMVARLSDGIFTYGVKIGWVEALGNGTNSFTQTAQGTCNVKEVREAQ